MIRVIVYSTLGGLVGLIAGAAIASVPLVVSVTSCAFIGLCLAICLNRSRIAHRRFMVRTEIEPLVQAFALRYLSLVPAVLRNRMMSLMRSFLERFL